MRVEIIHDQMVICAAGDGAGRADVGVPRDGLLVEDHRVARVIGPFLIARAGLPSWRCPPRRVQPTPQIVFRHGFRLWLCYRIRTVSRPTRGTNLRLTASSATKRTVQRAAPEGGSLHTIAMMRCFSEGAKTSAAPGRVASNTARATPPQARTTHTTHRLNSDPAIPDRGDWFPLSCGGSAGMPRWSDWHLALFRRAALNRGGTRNWRATLVAIVALACVVATLLSGY